MSRGSVEVRQNFAGQDSRHDRTSVGSMAVTAPKDQTGSWAHTAGEGCLSFSLSLCPSVGSLGEQSDVDDEGAQQRSRSEER